MISFVGNVDWEDIELFEVGYDIDGQINSRTNSTNFKPDAMRIYLEPYNEVISVISDIGWVAGKRKAYGFFCTVFTSVNLLVPDSN